MKFYKMKKSSLNFTEMNQLNYKWKYPILIDESNNVYLGNSLKESLSDEVIVIIIKENQMLKDDLIYIESKIVEENSEKRIRTIENEVYNYIMATRKPIYKEEKLFHYEDKGLITEENYIKMENSFRKHNGRISEDEEEIIEDFEIDMEVLKDLI